ncbi:hypothetical protein, partial [Chitinophaga terrae (ex Kim and Jung 2007)]|uniref:hypothetical protein n=1 Tax=Chitinophaga terrae (ex Kim and Jung 2007) TaxID=408074 RepID=UPI0014574877
DRTPEREPQQAAPSSFISPGATADGKIKNEGQGCQAGGGRKISSEGMAGAIIDAWLSKNSPARPGAARAKAVGSQKA